MRGYLALKALVVPHMLFLTSRGSYWLLAQEYPIFDILRHRLVIVEEAFGWYHFLPTYALGRMLPSRIDLHWPDSTQQSVDDCTCRAG